MELYTLNRDFLKEETIDKFESAIWTERYYGDGDFELKVPANDFMMSKLPKGQLMMCEDSDQPMILETREIKDGLLKTTGITLVKWLNSRIFRTTDAREVKEYVYGTPDKPGEILTWLVQNFVISGPYLNGTIPIGFSQADLDLFPIPGLAIGATDTGGSDIELAIPFGYLYDILNSIATTYEVGMRIILDYATELDYQITFRNYRGEDRTSDQTVNPVIQFSKEMDSFTNITDLESISNHKNLFYIFGTNRPDTEPNFGPGRAISFAANPDPFDIRVAQEFTDEEIPTIGAPETFIDPVTRLSQKAETALAQFKVVQLVDGELVQTGQIKYGVDYFLGDIIEVVGNSGVLQKARISEYIRSQDSDGERAYPTLAMID